MVAIIEFETARLRLRQWRPADREPFAALNADAKVMEFFPATLCHTASNKLADHCETFIAERGWGPWVVQTKSTNEFVGFVGLHIPAPELSFSPCVEIAWRLAVQYWGQGLALEAAKGALQVGFELLNLADIVAFTSVHNIRSRAVMERLGMSATEEIFEHPHVPVGNGLRLHCLYRLSHEQWR